MTTEQKKNGDLNNMSKPREIEFYIRRGQFYNQISEPNVKNMILNDQEYIKEVKDELKDRYDLNQFNYVNGEFNIENEFNDNHVLYVSVDNENDENGFYKTNMTKIIRQNLENARTIGTIAVKCFKQFGEGYLKIYPAFEKVKFIAQGSTLTRVISYGTNIITNKSMNKVPATVDLLKIKEYSNLNTRVEENSTNRHDVLGKLRALEECCVKNEILRNYNGYLFVGIGENLKRFDDFPGVYYNAADDEDYYDQVRINKYFSETVKPVYFNRKFQANELDNDMYADGKIIIHSTDALYYLSNLFQEIKNKYNNNYEDVKNIVFYHTFNCYTKESIESYNDIYRLKTNYNNGRIYYKPNGNEQPYIHNHVEINGLKITKEFLETVIEKGEYEEYTSPLLGLGANIDILNAIEVSKYFSYITVRITFNRKNKNIVHSRNHCYINDKMLIKNEVDDEYVDEVSKLGNIKIIKEEPEKFNNYIFDQLNKWIDGYGSNRIEEIYSTWEDSKYYKGFYFMKDTICFLKELRINNNEEGIEVEKIRRFQRYSVEVKISKDKFNDILSMYRGISIKSNVVKNVTVAIINKAREDWKLEIDMHYAKVLAILAARYMGKINKEIINEVNKNQDIYDENSETEKLTWYEKLWLVTKQYTIENNQLISFGRKALNSTNVNVIKSFMQKEFSIVDNVNYWKKCLYLEVYCMYIYIKQILGISSFNEDVIRNRKKDIKYLMKLKRDYNEYGVMLQLTQDYINDDEKVRQCQMQKYFTDICSFIKLIYGMGFWRRVYISILMLFVFLISIISLYFGVKIFYLVDKVSINLNIHYTILHWDMPTIQYILINIILIGIYWFSSILDPRSRIIMQICTTPIIYLINKRLIAYYSIVVLLIKYKINPYLVCIYVIMNLIVRGHAYTDLEYVHKIIYNPGSCTMNDVMAMLSTVKMMYNNFSEYVKENKLTKRNAEKFKIKDIREPHIKHPHMPPNKEPLTQKGFKIDGYNVENNVPLKLHRCFYTETEAVYRQVQSKADYDDTVVQEFKNFIQPKIRELFERYNYGITPTTNEYMGKLGKKRNEFLEGYIDYVESGKPNFCYKMHVKTDEKIYMNYKKFKIKARNISAQNPKVKLIMGMVCETAMNVIHQELWCGPGKNNGEKCRIFKHFMDLVQYDQGVMCADGSAFDSTQHSILQEIVDNYVFELIINNHPEIQELASVQDIKKICYQQKYKIFSKYYTYECVGTQMTGRMNTCLGNTLRSWAYVEFIKYKMKQLYPWINIDRIQEMVNGDDQIIFMPKSYYDKYEFCAYQYVYLKEDKSDKHGLGQIAKIFDRYPDITGAEFLSMIILWNPINNHFFMVRKLERFLQMTPFTYHNNHINIKRFRYKQAQLLIADAQNIAASKNLEIFKIYGQKMNEIGVSELERLKNNMRKDEMRKINKQIKDYKFLLQFQNHYEGLTNADEFEEIYKQYLNKYFNITDDDINELILVINSINPSNYLEKFRCHIVDKLMNVITYDEYKNTENQINKTKVDVEIHLDGNKMVIDTFENCE